MLLVSSAISIDRLLVDAREDGTGVDALERLFSLLMLRLMLLLLSVGMMALLLALLELLLVLFTLLLTRQPVPPLMLIRGTLRMFSPVVAVVIVVVVVDVVSVEADVV